MSVAHPAPGKAAFPPSTLPNTAPFRGIIGFSRLNSEAHRHPMVIVRGEGIRPFDSYEREYVGGVVGFEPLATGAHEWHVSTHSGHSIAVEPGAHAVLFVDRAGWHVTAKLWACLKT
jgi:hypothetical protein